MSAPVMDASFTELVDKFGENLQNRGLAELTCKNYSAYIRRYLEWTEVSAQKVTADTYATWINEQRKGNKCGASSIRLRLSAGRAFFGWRVMDLGPLGEYKAPPLPPPDPTPLPGGMDDVRRMIDAAQNDTERLLIGLGGFAGLRVSESTGLKWSNVDFANGELLVTGKGDKFRRIPMNRDLRKLLVASKKGAAWRSSDLAVGLTQSAGRARIIRIGVDARIAMPVVNSHDLRATFATVLYERTKDLLMVSKLLGHANVATTQRYLAGNKIETRSAVEAL